MFANTAYEIATYFALITYTMFVLATVYIAMKRKY